MESGWNTIVVKVVRQFQEELPFVLYAKPGRKNLRAILQHDAVLHTTTNFDESGFVFTSFDGERSFLIPEHESDSFVVEIPDVSLSAEIPEANCDETAKGGFENLVSKGIAAIKSGKFSKVVLSRKEAVTLFGFDFTAAFAQLLAAYPTAFRYCWFHPETGLWMGATPERLLKIENDRLDTVALAGTQPYRGLQEVIWPEKEQAEQRFVTDFIAEGLRGKVSNIQISAPYTAKAGNLLHIKTDISGNLDDGSDLGEILDILHPTPAVCGYPKADAKKFILENEGYDREFYSGFLGEINTGSNASTDVYVNLRSMKIAENSAYLYMGCGITTDSDPEKEFLETAGKSLTMKRILCNWIS